MFSAQLFSDIIKIQNFLVVIQKYIYMSFPSSLRCMTVFANNLRRNDRKISWKKFTRQSLHFKNVVKKENRQSVINDDCLIS